MTPARWQRIEELFHEARERAPDDRPAFVDLAAAGDPDLRQQVVSLLEQQSDPAWVHGGLPAMTAAVVARPERVDYEGRVFGPYILGPRIGAGGMSDVYRTRDTKLGRDVAVKILAEPLPHDSERLARVELEARVLAALNHPNIATIHGFEESDGLRGLVLEFVDGVTLKDKLHGGRTLPVDKCLSLAGQIARALEAAHDKGIVHRDLKPSNVKVTPSGLVKVLDFGLAKITQPEGSDPAALPVLSTGDGVVLGTVAYMSPEQARGLAVDRRTDIWAFGCVLYEMLSGQRAFRGESAADVLGSITAREPDWAQLPAATPDRARQVLRRCLAKDAARRYHAIADARIELEEAEEELAHPVGPVGSAGSDAAPRRGRVVLWLLAAALVVSTAIAVWRAPFTGPGETSVRPVRVAIPLPADVSLYNIGRGSSVAVSPDGQRIVFVGLSQGRRRLYVRSLDANDATPLTGTDDAVSPFFSPDGLWIGFISNNPAGSLMKMPAEGGSPVTLVSSLDGDGRGLAVQGAMWASDGVIVLHAINPAGVGIWQVPANGGSPARVTTPREGEGMHLWPQRLPASQAVVYTIVANPGFDSARVVVEHPASGDRKTLVEQASYGRVIVSAGGSWLVFARPESLYAVPFDIETLSVQGEAFPIVGSVGTNLSGGAHFSVSATGLLAYVPGGLDELTKTALWVDRAGDVTEIGAMPGLGFVYRLSPDGRRLARPGMTGRNRDLWIEDLERRGQPLRLTVGIDVNRPVWTPDGQRIVYAAGRPISNLFSRNADGSGPEERLTRSDRFQSLGSVSRDGTTLVYHELSQSQGTDIWRLSLSARHEPQRVLATPFAELDPEISPDGRWIAYRSNMSGPTFEIYLTPVAGGGRQIPVSKGGGQAPLWSRTGRELYYRDRAPEAGGNMMVVSVDLSGDEPRLGTPRVLFPSPYQGGGDVTADGRFFLVQRTPEESRSRVIELVMNWFEDLQAKAPR